MTDRYEHLPQERDYISTPVIVTLVTVGSIFLAASLVWPWQRLAGIHKEYAHLTFGAPPHVIEPHPQQLGGLLQTLLEDESKRPRTPPQTAYQWTDRQHGLITMPIEDAMELWLARHGTPPANQPAPAAGSATGGAP